jgi:hypothetical protein
MKFKHLREKISRLGDEVYPSPMLVLRRKGIRIFPDGSHVALYTNDKYNLVFTVPYAGPGIPTNVGQPIVGSQNA